MPKRVFIIHGWGGYPEEGWLPWLKQELEGKGFQVEVPSMPNTDNPKIDVWVPFLKDKVGTPDQETFLVGHSIGCQTILRYLESLPEGAKVGGAVLVAGFVHLAKLDETEEQEIAKPWLETPIQWEKILTHTNNFAAIFSDNDPFVPLDDSKIFESKLGAKIIVQSEKGHFSGSDNINELPVALEELLRMAK